MPPAPQAAEAAPPTGAEQQNNGGAFFLPAFIRSRLPAGAASAQEPEITCGLTTAQRFQMFMLLMVGAVAMFGMAFFMFLPLIIIVPSKFATSFTLGSLLFMAAFFIWRGPRFMTRQLLQRDRLAFTASYALSTIGTLWSCLVVHSWFLAISMSFVQFMALLWFAATYVPGGQTGMAFLTRGIYRVVRAICLPIWGGAARAIGLQPRQQTMWQRMGMGTSEGAADVGNSSNAV